VRLQGNTYTFVFALIVCIICSFTLALVSEGLKEQKELNVSLDIKKNILKAVGLKDPLDSEATPETILKTYNEKIEELVIDGRGDIIEGKSPNNITKQKDIVDEDEDTLHVLYIYKEDGQAVAYCLPIFGQGLWSKLYGYLALEPDAVTLRGITFYKHGETPGLGAEIEKEWFQENFVGKKIWDIKNNKLVPTTVVKGKVVDKISDEIEQQYYVDGISGATMTSKGVTEMLDRWLRAYEPFFEEIRAGQK